MAEEDEILDVGKEITALINSLPPEERGRYQRALSAFIHDLRQSISVVFTASSLLRRKTELKPDELELLTAIDSASKRAMFQLTDFAKPLDSGITVPLGKRPDLPKLG